jgi:hypothetical protein
MRQNHITTYVIHLTKATSTWKYVFIFVYKQDMMMKMWFLLSCVIFLCVFFTTFFIFFFLFHTTQRKLNTKMMNVSCWMLEEEALKSCSVFNLSVYIETCFSSSNKWQSFLRLFSSFCYMSTFMNRRKLLNRSFKLNIWFQEVPSNLQNWINQSNWMKFPFFNKTNSKKYHHPKQWIGANQNSGIFAISQNLT